MSWIKEPIKNLFNIEKGSLQSSKNIPGEYDFITAAADWKTNQTYDHECEALVFACAASGSLGRTHYVNGKFIASDLCFILTPKDWKKINMKFYHTYFNSIRKDIVKKTATGSAKLAINRKNFGNYEIVYGNIDDQNKAQTLFGKYLPFQNELSANVDESKELVNKLRQSILQDAIKGKLIEQNPADEQASELLRKIKEEKEKLIKEKKIKKEKPLEPIKDEEKPFDIPSNWGWVRLGEVSKKIFAGGDKPEIFSKEPTEELNVPVIANGETNDGLYGYTNTATVNTKSLTVSGRGTIGFSVIRDYPYTPIVRLIVIEGLENISLEYLKIVIQASLVKGNGSAIPQLTVPMISPLLIPLPPLDEQKRIVTKLDELMKLCDELEEKINSTWEEGEKLVDSVLQNIFRDS